MECTICHGKIEEDKVCQACCEHDMEIDNVCYCTWCGYEEESGYIADLAEYQVGER